MISLRPSIRTVFFAGTLLAGVVAVSACSGQGSSNLIAVKPAPPTFTAPPITQASFSTVTTVQTLPTPAPNATPVVSIAMPSTSGFSGSVGLPVQNAVIPAGTQITESLAAPNQPPAGLPTLSFMRAGESATRQTLSATNHTVIAYLGLYFSNAVTLPSAPLMTFAVPQNTIVSGANYYLALYDPLRPQLGWQDGFEGPGTVSGSSVSFGGTGVANPFTYAGFSYYWFALYAASASAAAPTPAPVVTPLPSPAAPSSTPTPTATATPVPTPTPTPVPTPVPQFAVAPSTISLTAAGQTATFAASGVAPFTISGGDAHVATVSPSSGNGTFTATAVAAGQTTFTVTDAMNRTATVTVTVTTTTIPIQ